MSVVRYKDIKLSHYPVSYALWSRTIWHLFLHNVFVCIDYYAIDSTRLTFNDICLVLLEKRNKRSIVHNTAHVRQYV